MATESDLRDLLRDPDPEGRDAIDLDAVLSRARRRRRPRVIAAQALGSVAVIGVLGTAIFVAVPRADQTAASSAQDVAEGGAMESAPLADDSALKWMPDACGSPLSEQASTDGLSLELVLPTTVDPGSSTRIPLTVTLHNDGTERLTGTTSAPVVTFSQHGLVLWHSSATTDGTAAVVDLAPGETVSYDAVVDAVVCSAEEDLVADDPGSTLPAAGPGNYELRAVLVIDLTDGTRLVASTLPLSFEIGG